MYKTLYFKNCTFENILCYGDSDASSLIEFDSCIYGDELNMNNVTIRNCQTNSDLITISGNNSYIKLTNINFSDNISYGSLLNNISQEVSIYI